MKVFTPSRMAVLGIVALLLVQLDAAPAGALTIGKAVSEPHTRALYGVTCPTSDTCIAVGQDASRTHGVVVFRDGGESTAVSVPGSVQLHGVGCATASTCFAVGK